MLRSYGFYLDYSAWFVFAERSTKHAQEMLRQFDKKCRFDFSYVPEPIVDEAEEARIAALMKEAQAEIDAENNQTVWSATLLYHEFLTVNLFNHDNFAIF